MGKETPRELDNIAIAGTADKLLGASIKSSGVMKGKPYTPQSAKYAKLTLGYLNGLAKAFQVKINLWRLGNVPQKIKVMKKIFRTR